MPENASREASAGNTGDVAPAPPRPRSSSVAAVADGTAGQPAEIGGRGGPDPTRYGDWEKNGRCIDF